MVILKPVYYPLFEDNEKFIILITGGRGCESPEQEIIMSDMSIKKLKDVQIGDYVMGDDFTPRKVLDKLSGRSEMYRVHQSSAEDYIVNDAHIISVRKDGSSIRDGRYPDYAEFTDMNVVSYMNQSKRFRERFHGYKCGSIPYAEKEVKIAPYLLGLWLGDGTSVWTTITTPEPEIKAYLKEYADTHDLKLTCNGVKGQTETLRLARAHGNINPLMTALREYDLLHNKHIPQDYISNSETVRLELLAGLLDTDGHMERNGYEITQKSKEMAKQIKFISDSLGFRTSMSEKRAHIGEKDCGIYYRIFINGDTWRIPCRVERKKVHKEGAHKNKDWRRSQLSVEPIGVGDWCGICLDGNQRYLHSDGTVTHNSGKSFGASTFLERLTFEYNKEMGISHNILLCRYTMTSASISVIPEFTEKIDLDGTAEYFRTTKQDVVNKMTGARVMFRGIHTSSGNQTAKLKSIQGITTFVCDEAEEWTNYDDFEKIMLSIRQKGLQNRIIIIMNPADTNHFVYEKYIKDTHKLVEFDGVPVQISTHPDVLHIHTSYLDNIEHLSENFLNAAREMKENDPERYAHIFMGRWDDVAEGAVFKKFGIVDEFPEDCQHVGLGMDFGYFPDPSAVVRCGIIGNKLYIDEVGYAQGWHAPQMAECLNQYPDLFTYGESADERLTNDIAHLGPIIYRVEKGPGSIMAGINKMLEYEIFITKRSVHLEHELRNYVWAKDVFGKYVGMPEDHDNHCIDSARYYIRGRIQGKILKPRATTKEELGIF